MKIMKRKEAAPATPVAKPWTPEDFFDRMKEFEDAMTRRACDLFRPDFYTPARALETLFRDAFDFVPVPIEVTESKDGLVVHAEVPGFNDHEIEVRVEPRRLFIGGKREETAREKKGKTVYSERTANQIASWFELGSEIVPDKVKATLNKGLLEITLQKAQPAKKVPIHVKAA